jgi:hypothetical protein
MRSDLSRPRDRSLEAIHSKLLAYCRANDWAGYDPYDALNSEILKSLPFLNFRVARIAFTQFLKRSPINFRRLLRIPKKQNPKALALFLSALMKLRHANRLKDDDLANTLIERLIALRSQNVRYCCWGYSFPWQTLTATVPDGAPNLVCTAFVANALLDAYEELSDPRCLSTALDAAEYLATELYWSEGDSLAGFAYPLPSLRAQVHNANLLGAALLGRAARHGGDAQFLELALKVARYSVSQQRADGSWLYGEMPSQRWIDNFHTGYNLCALQAIGRDAQTSEFEGALRRGFEFYRANFFGRDGEPKYFHNRAYPIDIHCAAQSIITLVELADLGSDSLRLAHSVLNWTLQHMWDDRGFFYYRFLPLLTIRTSYMRWSQAWMFLALSTVMSQQRFIADQPSFQGARAFVSA